jgi:FAD/FMN-containing dehydrogenase
LSVYRQVPIGVVIPKSLDDVIATVAACRKFDVPILGRGCGSSLAGQTCNVAVVIDFSKYLNRIEDIDPQARLATVQPGVICEELRRAAAAHRLTFAPDPATHEYCTIGGMIGNNSCGVHTLMGGKTVDNTEALEILTYDGTIMRVCRTDDDAFARIAGGTGRRAEIYRRLRELRDLYAEEIRQRYPRIPRRVSGYNLDALLPENGFDVARALVGSESTCALTLRATLRLVPRPPCRSLLLVGCRDIGVAGDHTAALREMGPIGLEAVHSHALENMHRSGKSPRGAALYPRGDSWLLVEFGGETQDEADAAADRALRRIRRLPGITEVNHVSSPRDQTDAWAVRKGCVGASRVPGLEEAWPSWEDAAVDPAKLGDYLREFGRLVDRHGYHCTLFGHFGDGCVHSRIDFDFTSAEGVRRFRTFMEKAADLVLSYGGSLSGEHGDGQARAELLPKMFGPDLIRAFRKFKQIWDPRGRMNPGKVVEPYSMTENLRLGPGYNPRPVETYFEYPEDGGSFAHAVERCFGVGRCRKTEGATMCPSFQATREEKYTTRGRALLLFEMMRSDSIDDGWRN